MSLGEAYKAFLEKENLKDEDTLKKAFDYGRDFGYSELKSSLEETEFYDDCKEQEKKNMEDEFDFELDDSIPFEDLI